MKTTIEKDNSVKSQARKSPIKRHSNTIAERIKAFKQKHPEYLGCTVAEMRFVMQIGKVSLFDSYGTTYDYGYLKGYEKAMREARNKK